MESDDKSGMRGQEKKTATQRLVEVRKEPLVGFGILERTLAGSLEERGSDLKMCG